MRSTIPLLSRAQDARARSPTPDLTSTPPQAFHIPTIRLVAATPSAAGSSVDPSSPPPAMPLPPLPTASASPLAPRTDAEQPRKRVVPKKSKLGLLGSSRAKNRDFSDVVRRVGATPASTKGGFEIYVDPGDPDIGEIVMVKKKKSRAALGAVGWGGSGEGALGDKTNASAPTKKGSTGVSSLLKVKADDSQKWWSIGRGRKDSKEKAEKAKKGSNPPIATATTKAARSSLSARARFNSLDSGVMLNSPPTDLPPELQDLPQLPGDAPIVSFGPPLARPVTPDAAAVHLNVPAPAPAPHATLLAPPMSRESSGTGSIALRAMRSMRSIANMGGWAGSGSMRAAKEDKGEEKERKEEEKDRKKKKKDRKEKEDGRAGNARGASSSSFEVGAPSVLSVGLGSPEAAKTEKAKTMGKKKSVLGLGLGWPSTLRGAPSELTARAPSPQLSAIDIGPSAAPTAFDPSRLSVSSVPESTGHAFGHSRPVSRATVSSGTSSLRPLSSASGSSVESGSSAYSGIGSAASVKWDEDGLATVREERGKNTAARGKRTESRVGSEGRRRGSLASVFADAQSAGSGAGRPLSTSSAGSDVAGGPLVRVERATADGHAPPTDEECEMVVDLGSEEEQPEVPAGTQTPAKKARARPMSEQMLGRVRPRGMTDDSEGVMSILDAATNDLASLINRLDLQATPCTPDVSPFKPSSAMLSSTGSLRAHLQESPLANLSKKAAQESPLKKKPQPNRAMTSPSIQSLRPYAQSRGKATLSSSTSPVQVRAAPLIGLASVTGAHLVGQQIAPWPTLSNNISPAKPPVKARSPTARQLVKRAEDGPRPGHKRTLTPGPLDEPLPVFQPLRPAKARKGAAGQSATNATKLNTPPASGETAVPRSSSTFGKPSSRSAKKLSFGQDIEMQDNASPTPVFRRAPSHMRNRSSLVPNDVQDQDSKRVSSSGMPLAPDAKRGLGLAGTMGGSVAPEDEEDDYAVHSEDPDSDIPDDLQGILSTQQENTSRCSLEDTLSFREPNAQQGPALPSPGAPPADPLPLPTLSVSLAPPILDIPVFRAFLGGDDEKLGSDIDALSVGSPTSSDDGDTKRSFDFTGELRKLNESGGSDRRSFVEQLESAFKTPSRIDLRGLGDFLTTDVPPVPRLPCDLAPAAEIIGSGVAVKSFALSDSECSSAGDWGISDSSVAPSSEDAHEVSLEESVDVELGHSIVPKPSDGRLNTNFRFGGVPRSAEPSPAPSPARPLTLSDIIPPPSHVRSLSAGSTSMMVEEDSAVLKSIFAKASDLTAAPRTRVESDSSSKRQDREIAMSASKGTVTHSRASSQVSFAGFESFEQVRRGFEFVSDRPAWYTRQPDTSYNSYRKGHGREESMFSVASISSYGSVLDAGVPDPFGFTAPARPQSSEISMSMSMSTTVDDTFSFIKGHQQRQRVDSDASSFYFRAPASNRNSLVYARAGHRRDRSTASVLSIGPPVSLYNRSFAAGHKRNTSSTDGSSVAHSYAMFGANGGRAAWARHRQDPSVDSVMSDMSAMRLGRPGVGDKMFESANDYGMPLTAISASPPESIASGHGGHSHSSSFDSLMDSDPRSATDSDPQHSTTDDSLFEKTGYRTTNMTGSVFGADQSGVRPGDLLPSFRPVSMISFDSDHDPRKEDDTMISMIGGGGHVRRCSIGSTFEGSPCVRAGKRKHSVFQTTMFQGRPILQDLDEEMSPNKARLVEKPSIASTSSSQFGGERMIRARHGLLERQSLEVHCLSAEGEDTTGSFYVEPIYLRAEPVSRPRSSTYSSSGTDTGTDTPPLSASDGSSISGGSQSDIDMTHLNLVLSNMTHPLSGYSTVRARARGRGHRRRLSQARASRSSVYETIQEEASVVMSSAPTPQRLPAISSGSESSVVLHESVLVVDSDRESGDWSNEKGISTVRAYYALKDEAHETVEESKRVWIDTPFSVFAVQTFDPPRHPEGMQALLEHSQKNYSELPSELRARRVRSRTQSRPSPYPRHFDRSLSPVNDSRPSTANSSRPSSVDLSKNMPMLHKSVLQPVQLNSNIASPAPALDFLLKPFSPFGFDAGLEDSADEKAPAPRPRVNSSVRRSALGWAKRGANKSATQKENMSHLSQDISMKAPGSLRINRPRPRGRPTPARQQPLRV